MDLGNLRNGKVAGLEVTGGITQNAKESMSGAVKLRGMNAVERLHTRISITMREKFLTDSYAAADYLVMDARKKKTLR
jgi:hypothetical protein